MTRERSRARAALGAAKARAINSVLTFFDHDWNRQPFTHSGYSQVPDKDVKRPTHFLQMRDAAETLGGPFPFARIDLYDLPEGPKFGEITLTPLSGHQRFTPDEYDMHLGALLALDAASIPPR